MQLAVLFPDGTKAPIAEDQVIKYNLTVGQLTPFSRLPIVEA
jgi:hypothetical protein